MTETTPPDAGAVCGPRRRPAVAGSTANPPAEDPALAEIERWMRAMAPDAA